MHRCVCVCRYFKTMYNKTLLDSVFVISAIIKVSVVISLSLRLNWQHLPRPSSLWISQKLLPIIVHCKGKHLAVTVTSSHIIMKLVYSKLLRWMRKTPCFIVIYFCLVTQRFSPQKWLRGRPVLNFRNLEISAICCWWSRGNVDQHQQQTKACPKHMDLQLIMIWHYDTQWPVPGSKLEGLNGVVAFTVIG